MELRNRKIVEYRGTTTGIFERLPIEVTFYLFRKTNARLLAKLALCSHSMLDMITSFVFSVDARKRYAEDVVHKNYQIKKDPYVDWGSLIKAITCIYPTKRRIEFVEHFYLMNHNVGDQCGWGRLFMRLMDSWDFCECALVFDALLDFDDGRARKCVDKVVNSKLPGTYPEDEMLVRDFIRGTFLDHRFEDVRDRPFWLSVLLLSRNSGEKKHKDDIAKQARLLLILYAPVKTEGKTVRVDWKSLCDIAVTTLDEARQRVLPFSEAIGALRKVSQHEIVGYEWHDHEIFTLIEEVTTMPEPWALDNFAAMLVLQPELAPISLLSRCLQKYETEAGLIVNAMKTVSIKKSDIYPPRVRSICVVQLACRWHLDPNRTLGHPLLMTLRRIPTVFIRRTFFGSITAAHQKHLSDLMHDTTICTHEERNMPCRMA